MGSFRGTSSAVSVTDDGKELTFSVPVSSIDTDNDGRNKDMVKRFTDDKHKNVVLTVPRDKIHVPTDKPTAGTARKERSPSTASKADVSVKYDAEKTERGHHRSLGTSTSTTSPTTTTTTGTRRRAVRRASSRRFASSPELVVAVNGKFKE